MRLTAVYAILAVLAILVNLVAQEVSIRLYAGPYGIPLAVAFGTGVGLVVKYLLDKRYIFAYRAPSAGQDVRTFVLYAMMGVITTAIFWGVEFLFHYLYGVKEMRYLGGGLGLGLGYLLKYYLDKRFVFAPPESLLPVEPLCVKDAA